MRFAEIVTLFVFSFFLTYADKGISMSTDTANMVFAGISALGGVSGLLSVIFLICHRTNDKKDSRIEKYLEKYQNNKQNGGRFLEHLIPSGINLLKDDTEISEALDSLQSIYHTHPLRGWDSDIKRIGYKNFFKYVVNQTNILNADNIEGYINSYPDIPK